MAGDGPVGRVMAGERVHTQGEPVWVRTRDERAL